MYNYNYNPYFSKQATVVPANAQMTDLGQTIYQGPDGSLQDGNGNPVTPQDPPPGLLDRFTAGVGNAYGAVKDWGGQAANYMGNKWNEGVQLVKDHPVAASLTGLATLAALGAGGYYLYNRKKKDGEKSASLLAKEASYYFYKQAEDAGGGNPTSAPNHGILAKLQGYGNQAWNYTTEQAQAINNWVAQNPWLAAAIAGGVGLGGGALGGYMLGTPSTKKKKR